MKIRRIAADERFDTILPLRVYAFDSSPKPADELEKMRRYAKYAVDDVTLAAEDGGTVVASVSGIPMRQNVRGSVYPMAGIAGVTTHPLARRQGHVRTLLTQLLGEMRDSGHVLSALYPFRPSFYEKFGYVGLPKAKRVSFSPAGLSSLLRTDLPGDVSLARNRDGLDAYVELTRRLLDVRHGFSVFPAARIEWWRNEEEYWLVTARVDGEVVGSVPYRIVEHGGDLVTEVMLTTGAHGRALLLRFFAQHVDQVARVVTTVPADEMPELWATEFSPTIEAKVSSPGQNAPMARVLSMDGLAGMSVGPGRAAVTVVDDPFIAGHYLLDGTGGKLEVSRTGSGAATLTVPGLSALVYGVLDPVDITVRGLGDITDESITELRALFPTSPPFIHADF